MDDQQPAAAGVQMIFAQRQGLSRRGDGPATGPGVVPAASGLKTQVSSAHQPPSSGNPQRWLNHAPMALAPFMISRGRVASRGL